MKKIDISLVLCYVLPIVAVFCAVPSIVEYTTNVWFIMVPLYAFMAHIVVMRYVEKECKSLNKK